MRHKHIIIVRIWEGLGNQMFQYAYARMLSLQGNQVYLDFDKAYEEKLASKFYGTERKTGITHFCIKLKGINVFEYKHYNYIEQKSLLSKMVFGLAIRGMWPYKFFEEKEPGYSIRKERIRGNSYVKGWFQSEKYFNKYRDVLLREFIPKEKIKISPRLKYLLDKEETVSIHIRRTDYIRNRNVLVMNYYKRAIAVMNERVKEPVYIIFTDDYEWVKKNFQCGEESYFIDENENLLDYEQLLVMSKCKNNIIANSTFSWWAAWLNRNPNKFVISPSKWFEGQDDLFKCDWMYLIK